MRSMLAGTFALVTAASALAQCDPEWLPGMGVGGANGYVFASVSWDPDGAGPQEPVWVIGGEFTLVDSTPVANLATWDPVTRAWGTLGGGADGSVHALLVLPNGDLVIGGAFETVGSVAAKAVARWDGTSWSPYGPGIEGRVNALALHAGGDLIAAGSFGSSGGYGLSNIARWSGVTWAHHGMLTVGEVDAVVSLPNGDLVFAGDFMLVQPVQGGAIWVNHIARWDGSAWSLLGSGLGLALGPIEYGRIFDLAVLPSGGIVAGGRFSENGFRNLARWNGSNWLAMVQDVDSDVRLVQATATGDLLIGASAVTVGGVTITGIARYDGAAWSALGPGVGGWATAATQMPDGSVLAAGVGLPPGPPGVTSDIARFEGQTWELLSEGFNSHVTSLAVRPGGEVVVGGQFTSVGGNNASAIASWDGANWTTFARGLNRSVMELAMLPNGHVVAAGRFDEADGQPAEAIALWDGSSWSDLSTGFAGSPNTESVSGLAVMPGGDLVISGQFDAVGGVAARSIARWDGQAWHAMGHTQHTEFGQLVEVSDGVLLAVVFLQGSGYQVMRWTGSSWQPVGTTFPGAVLALVTLPDGDLIAGGTFESVGGVPARGIARWDGAVWSELGGGIDGSQFSHVQELHVLPDGDLLVAGEFSTAGGAPVSNIARWDGNSWSSVDLGLDGRALAVATLSNGDVMVGGEFEYAGGNVSVALATLRSGCPAAVVATAPGCSGSAGLNELVADGLPWAGSAFRSRATGLMSPALALGVFGLADADVPLPALLPEGAPGCTLAVRADILEFYLPQAGTLELVVDIPHAVALAGVEAYEQVLAAELDGQGQIVLVTSTNGLRATIGVF